MITHDLRAISENLRDMVRHGVNPTPRELTRLADRLDGMADTLGETEVFAPRIVSLRRALVLVEGGKN